MIDYHFIITAGFIIGYLFIIFEHAVKVNKAASALLTGIFCWGVYLNFGSGSLSDRFSSLSGHLADISEVLFFLIGAMTIVELISSHQGFHGIRKIITTRSPKKLMWVFLWLGFWMSSMLDNLTAILVLVTIMRQVIPDKPLRQLLAAGLVFAVNVGGVWTPIGDITTTMLWITHRVDTLPLMSYLFVPSLLSLSLFGALFSFQFRKDPISEMKISDEPVSPWATLILTVGTLGLISVPIMKIVFNVPPYMGMMASLGVLWVITDRIYRKSETQKSLKIEHILTKIDISCIMFFFGVLLAVDALEAAGILDWLQEASTEVFSNVYSFSVVLGLLSSVVDNVPLVAGVIKMMDLSQYPPNDLFWNLIAFCAGVGGTILIIGSAPGVAVMSIKDISYLWYLKKVSFISLISFLFGCALIWMMNTSGIF